MARKSVFTVSRDIIDGGLIPVFYNGNVEAAINIVKACYDGGAKTVEFTNRGAHAYDVFNDLSAFQQENLPGVHLGAGTIMDLATAAQYINAGAAFIVSPTFSIDVARVCNRRRILYIPGCQTPTEISTAEEAGCNLVKLFPANVLTPNFIKALMGPMPQTQLIPSGGVKVEHENIAAWIGSGAVALNIGSELIRKDLVESGKFDVITENVKQCITWIRESRKNQRT